LPLKPLFFIAMSLLAPAAGVENDQGQPGEGHLTLKVHVTNGTAAGKSVIGDPVRVGIYNRVRQLTNLEGTVGPGGMAVFENVVAGQGLKAVPSVRHEQLEFNGPAVLLSPSQKQVTAEVQVFDVCYDKSKLSAGTHHLIIERNDRSVVLSEYIQLINPSDLAISSRQRDGRGKAVVLTISLPKGYKNFRSSSFLVTDALGFTETGFYDTMAVPPGKHNVIFSYDLDINSDVMRLVKEITLPTASFIVFSKLGKGMVGGLGKPSGEVTMPDGSESEYYNLGRLFAGERLKIKITGLSTNAVEFGWWVVLMLVFGALTLFAIGKAFSPTTGSNEIEHQ